MAADTARSFRCPTPVWGQGGAAPEKAEWYSVLTVTEANRVMPSPEPPTVFVWKPNQPLVTGVPATVTQISGPKNKQKFYNFDIDLKCVGAHAPGSGGGSPQPPLGPLAATPEPGYVCTRCFHNWRG